jgi:hypothetical protein
MFVASYGVKYHKNATGAEIHVAYRWVWADSAARVGQSVSGEDTLKIGYQKDDYSVWFLSDSTPTWHRVGSYKSDSLYVFGDITAGSFTGGDITGDSLYTSGGIDAARAWVTLADIDSIRSNILLRNDYYIGIHADTDLLQLSSAILALNGDLSINDNRYIGVDSDTDLLQLFPGALVVGGDFRVDDNRYIGIDSDGDLLQLSTNSLVVAGAITSTTLNTGHGANNLYAMDQDVLTTSNVTFNGATASLVDIDSIKSNILLRDNYYIGVYSDTDLLQLFPGALVVGGDFRIDDNRYIGIDSDDDLLQLLVNSLVVSGGLYVSGACTTATINTGQGDKEIGQSNRTTDDMIFDSVTVTDLKVLDEIDVDDGINFSSGTKLTRYEEGSIACTLKTSDFQDQHIDVIQYTVIGRQVTLVLPDDLRGISNSTTFVIYIQDLNALNINPSEAEAVKTFWVEDNSTKQMGYINVDDNDNFITVGKEDGSNWTASNMKGTGYRHQSITYFTD